MLKKGDLFVWFLIFNFLILYLLLKYKKKFKLNRDFKIFKKNVDFKGELADFLKEEGFEIVEGKTKIPLIIETTAKKYESRVILDCLVKKDDKLYVVFVAKERKPIRFAGPTLRDAFFMHYLLLHPDAILYVDKEKKTFTTIKFTLGENNLKLKNRASFSFTYFLVGFICGLLFLTFFFKKG